MPSAVLSRRKVISTAMPMDTSSGADVGELDREAATAVEVAHGEDDRRRRRVGQRVDGEGGDGGGARRPSGRGPCRRRCRRRSETRAGGRCSAPDSRSVDADEAVLPVQTALRRRRRHAGRFGTVRRLHGQHAPPRQVLGVGQRVVAARDLLGHRTPGPVPRLHRSVTRKRNTSAPSASDDERDDLAGRRLLDQVRQQHQGVGRAGEADRRRPGCRPRPRRAAPSFLARPAPARAWGAATATRCTWSTSRPASFRRGVPGPGGELVVALLAEPLLPAVDAELARGPPAIQELLGGRCTAQVLGDQRSVLGVADQHTLPRRRRRRAHREIRPCRCGRRRPGPARRARSSAARTAAPRPTPRSPGPASAATTSPSRRRAAWTDRGARLLHVDRRGRGEPERGHPCPGGGGARARRPASTARVTESSS